MSERFTEKEIEYLCWIIDEDIEEYMIRFSMDTGERQVLKKKIESMKV